MAQPILSATLPGFMVDDWSRDFLQGNLGLTMVGHNEQADIYRLEDGKYLFYFLDRLSVCRFILPIYFSGIGKCVANLHHFWLTQVLTGYPGYLADGMDEILKNLHNADPNFEMDRCLVVNNIWEKILPFEYVFPLRGRDTSFFREFCDNGSTILFDDHLPAIFKKRCNGSAQSIIDMFHCAYETAYNHARKQTIIIAEMAFRTDGEHLMAGAPTILINDGSGTSICPYQLIDIVNWAEKVKLSKLNHRRDEDVRQVHALEIPGKTVRETIERFEILFLTSTGYELSEYQTVRFGN